MKILGISCGRVNGNSEILVKEALMAAEQECGAQVELIRLNDFQIHPCTGCNACRARTAKGHGISDCIWDDDFPTFIDHYLEADGVIVCAPIYIYTPAGNIRVLCDRMGPTYDVVLLAQRGADLPDSPYDKRIFKHRVGAFMTVGGTQNPTYASMAMGPMQQFQHSLRLDVVDRMTCLESDLPGAVLIHDEYIKKAHEIGIEVAKNCGVPEGKTKYYGAMGTCPVCHNDMMLVDEGSRTIKCPFCLAQGVINVAEDGTITTDFSGDDLKHTRNTVDEMASHGREIALQMNDWWVHEREWAPIANKYKTIKIPTTKPEKQLWKVRKD